MKLVALLWCTLAYNVTKLSDSFMKPIIALIDFIMMREGKKTLRYIVPYLC